MISEWQLLDLQEKIHRRTLRFLQASRYLAELNASGSERSETFVERITNGFQRARDNLSRARAELAAILASQDTSLIEQQQINDDNSTRIIAAANTELLAFLARNPRYLHSVHSRAFEEVVARLFVDMGFAVDLMKATHDGGKDIILRTDTPFGPLITYVQCKCHSPLRPVGIEVVRQLYGVQTADRVNKSMIVTTSYFTPDAMDFSRGLEFLISLKNYDDMVAWLGKYRSKG